MRPKMTQKPALNLCIDLTTLILAVHTRLQPLRTEAKGTEQVLDKYQIGDWTHLYPPFQGNNRSWVPDFKLLGESRYRGFSISAARFGLWCVGVNGIWAATGPEWREASPKSSQQKSQWKLLPLAQTSLSVVLGKLAQEIFKGRGVGLWRDCSFYSQVWDVPLGSRTQLQWVCVQASPHQKAFLRH